MGANPGYARSETVEDPPYVAQARDKSEDAFSAPVWSHAVNNYVSAPPDRLVQPARVPKATNTGSYTPGTDAQFTAEFNESGEALLLFITKRTVAKFDTFADAQKAAKALNNTEGY